MSPCAIAVVGHVDHGKTALVRALTGMETDRLKEEQERGLSIVLGFAHREYPSGVVEFIDAPGHESFIRTAVAGATGVRSILLVISAVDGVARQTREHLQIAALLGVATGVVAVTKCDLLANDLWTGHEAEIERELAGTPLAGQPVVFCSARTGFGLDRLNEALEALLRRTPPPPALAGVFLPLDRVFNLHGVGTVATGTLLGAALEVGAELVVEPSGRRATVRGLQARGLPVDRVQAGSRAAVQLRGVSVDDLRPGDVLCEPGRFCTAGQVDALVTISPGSRPLKHLESVRVLVGTRSAVAGVRLMEGRTIEPGGQGLAQFRFPEPVPTHVLQRAILRRLSPAETIGGAVVLDPAPAPSRRRSAERVAVLQAVLGGQPLEVASALAARDRGVVSLGEAARLLGLGPEALAPRLGPDFQLLGDGLVSPRPRLDAAARAYLDALAEAHRRSPTRPAVPVEVIRRALGGAFADRLVDHVERRLAGAGEIVVARGRVALATHDPLAALSEAQRLSLARIEALLLEGGASPPDPDEIRELTDGGDLLDLLIDLGHAVALRNVALRKTVVFHAQALVSALSLLARAFPPPAPFRTGEAREALATSRKFIVPLLEAFDERGWTRRDGDTRQISGPSPE